MQLPKILIIGQPFNTNTGGGITQSNLFKGWSHDRIAVVCTVHMFNNLNKEVCEKYYLLGNDEYKWKFPFSLIQRSVDSGNINVSLLGSENGKVSATPKTLRFKLVNQYLYPFLEYIGLIHSISSISVSKKLRKWIQEYNPDILYVQATTRETVRFGSLIYDFVRKPMIFHMMDDWPSSISRMGPFRNYWNNIIDKEFRGLLDRASVLLSISQQMSDEYKLRYKKEFIPFHNPIDIGFWKSAQKTNYAIGRPATLLYAGRIGTGILDSLEATARIIDQLNDNEKSQQSIQFIIQTESRPSWIDKYKSVKYREPVRYGELPVVFASADVLLLPYDFSEQSIRFIKFSMPTKAPEYMISGTPIVLFAPAETAIVKDSQKNGWSKLITKNNDQELEAAFIELFGIESERREIATRAKQHAEKNYDAEKVRSRFRELIGSLVN